MVIGEQYTLTTMRDDPGLMIPENIQFCVLQNSY